MDIHTSFIPLMKNTKVHKEAKTMIMYYRYLGGKETIAVFQTKGNTLAWASLTPYLEVVLEFSYNSTRYCSF